MLGGCRGDECVGETAQDFGGDEFAELRVPAPLGAGGFGLQPPPCGSGGLRVELHAVAVIRAAQHDLGAERVGRAGPSGGGEAVGDVAGIPRASQVTRTGVERKLGGVPVREGGELPLTHRHQLHPCSLSYASFRERRSSTM